MMLRRAVLALAALAPLPLRAQPGVDRPQPRLPTEPLVIVTRDGRRLPFTVEMAVAPEHQMIGLMFRPEVKPDEGMLFDWGAPRESSMWMRNTITSLDMVFIAADGRIHRIAERTVPLSPGDRVVERAGARDAGTGRGRDGTAGHPRRRPRAAPDLRHRAVTVRLPGERLGRRGLPRGAAFPRVRRDGA